MPRTRPPSGRGKRITGMSPQTEKSATVPCRVVRAGKGCASCGGRMRTDFPSSPGRREGSRRHLCRRRQNTAAATGKVVRVRKFSQDFRGLQLPRQRSCSILLVDRVQKYRIATGCRDGSKGSEQSERGYPSTSIRGARRPCFFAAPSFLAFSRRSLDPRLGFVARRFTGGVATERSISRTFS